MTQLGAPLHAGSEEYRLDRGHWRPCTPQGYLLEWVAG